MLSLAANDEDVANFVRDEVVAPVAFASSFARNMDRLFAEGEPPAIVYVTNPSDRHGNLMNEIIRASVEALIRGWRHEDETLANAGDLDLGSSAKPDGALRHRG